MIRVFFLGITVATIICSSIQIVHGQNKSLFEKHYFEGNNIRTDNSLSDSKQLLIVNILPNPIGDDLYSTEITIANIDSTDCELGLWKIKTSSNTYIFKSGIINGRSRRKIHTINRENILLKNNKEIIELINPSNNLVQRIKYEDAPEGSFFSLDFTTGFFSFREKIDKKLKKVERKSNKKSATEVKDEEVEMFQISEVTEKRKMKIPPIENVLSTNPSIINELPNHLPSVIITLLLAVSIAFISLRFQRIFKG